MRVLIVSHSGKTSGGAERSLMALVRYVVQNRPDIHLTMLFPCDGQESLRTFARDLGIEVLCAPYHRLCFAKTGLKLLRYGKLALLSLADLWRAGSLAKQLTDKFDVVYSNTCVIFFGAFLARQLMLPHIWHIREFGREYGLYFLPGTNHLRDSLTDRYLFTSQALMNSYRGSCDEKKMHVIYNGFTYQAYPKQSGHKGIHMLITGSIQKQKGQYFALKALNCFADAEEKIYLHIAGSFVDAEERKRIEGFIKDNALEENVIIHGFVKDMAELRSQMDMELICSQCEGFGRSTVEAMMSGLPVIAADCGATPEIIRDQETGFLYPLNDLKRFTELIAMLAADAELRERVGRKAQREATERFTLESYASKVIEQWESVL